MCITISHIFTTYIKTSHIFTTYIKNFKRQNKLYKLSLQGRDSELPVQKAEAQGPGGHRQLGASPQKEGEDHQQQRDRYVTTWAGEAKILHGDSRCYKKFLCGKFSISKCSLYVYYMG